MSKSKDKIMLSEPPRLLLGITFLFWGWMHDSPMAALIAAILVEGRHWTKLRWDFGEKGFARSWQLSAVILIISAIGLLQKDVLRAADFLNLLSWLPFMMLPLMLAQQYTRAGGIPIVTFSFIARRKLVADRKAGRPVDNSAIQLGYPFIVLVLATAGMGVGSLLSLGSVGFRYVVGISFLLGWSLFKMREKKARPLAWGVAYLASMAIAVVISLGLLGIYRYWKNSFNVGGSRQVSALETQTSIGQVRELQLNPKILWRYFHEKGEIPALLKLGAYNEPLRNIWQARTRRMDVKERIPAKREVGGDFEMFLDDGQDQFIYHEGDRGNEEYSVEGRLVGLISEQTLIPHFQKTKRYEGVPADILGVNSFGAVQMVGVNEGAMDARIFSNERSESIEHDPTNLDLTYPKKEEEGLSGFLRRIGLAPAEDGLHPERALSNMVSPESHPPDISEEKFREIEARLSLEFGRDFQYSLFLTGTDLNAPISQFLNQTKKGHCEYFAGSTAMLLRRMGIPTRYAVGFALQEESDDGEWVRRGQHVHAWAQAYVGGTWVNEPKGKKDVWRCRGGGWVDVDLTPPDWLSRGTDRPWYQFFSDWFQKARADLALWFARPSVLEGFKIAMMIVVPLFVIYLVYQLIQTRGREESGSWDEAVAKAGLLHDFERWLARRVGPRPRAVPMGTWLRQHLPADVVSLADSYEAATYRQDKVTTAEFKIQVRAAKLSWKARKNPGTNGSTGLSKKNQQGT
ncbi:MAG: hypothetical protein ACJAVK_003539 [Akkermansiaceae bacterium]|jgi:hypothetical protein